MAKRPRRTLYPMPVQRIVENPDFLALPVAGRGILLTIMLHYWQTGCKPLPKGNEDLQAIARSHRPIWYKYKSIILEIFADVQPDLDAYKRERDARGTNARLMFKAGADKANAQRRLNALSQPVHESLPAYASGWTPKKSPPTPPRPAAPGDRPPRKIMTDRPKM